MLQQFVKFGIAATFILAVNTSVMALDCPEPPRQMTKDSKAEVKTAIGRIGPMKGAELEIKVKRETKDLLSSLPNADKLYLEHMMYASYCSSLRDDKSLTEAQRRKELNEFHGHVVKIAALNEDKKPKGPREAKKPEDIHKKDQVKEADNLVGKWLVKFSNGYSEVLFLKQYNNSISGSLSTSDGSKGFVEGAFTDKVLELSRQTGMNTIQQYRLTFVSKDRMKGDYWNEGSIPDRGTMEATRQE